MASQEGNKYLSSASKFKEVGIDGIKIDAADSIVDLYDLDRQLEAFRSTKIESKPKIEVKSTSFKNQFEAYLAFHLNRAKGLSWSAVSISRVMEWTSLTHAACGKGAESRERVVK